MVVVRRYAAAIYNCAEHSPFPPSPLPHLRPSYAATCPWHLLIGIPVLPRSTPRRTYTCSRGCPPCSHNAVHHASHACIIYPTATPRRIGIGHRDSTPHNSIYRASCIALMRFIRTSIQTAIRPSERQLFSGRPDGQVRSFTGARIASMLRRHSCMSSGRGPLRARFTVATFRRTMSRVAMPTSVVEILSSCTGRTSEG